LSEPDKRKPEEWGAAYESERGVFSAYTVALEVLLAQLLDKAGIPYVQLEGRTKGVANFVSKLRRKQEKYVNPLEEVTDLTGLRVVLYYLDDVERVGELIEEQFDVDPAHSGDKGASMDPDRFGYLSVHYVVRPSLKRNSLPEWTTFADLSAEIQVRTVLQHAWGAISRKLAYASVQEAPRDLQRSLNRLSALLELADDEFVDIRTAREAIEQQYDREVERGNLELDVDESSLDIYLRESGAGERISKLAREAGSPTAEAKEAHWDEETADLADEWRQTKTRDLLTVLKDIGIGRISELDETLDGLWKSIPSFMKVVNEGYADDDGLPISAVPETWLILVLLRSMEAPPEQFSALGYVPDLVDIVVSTYEQPAAQG
jgi:putative GTP pyrophosphokinase